LLRDLVVLFGAGVASFLAPCVVPLLPAYLGMVAGEAAPAGDGGHDRSVRATALFVLGFAIVFALLGATAGALGGSLDTMQSAIQRVGGVLVIIMGLALLGIVRGPLAAEHRLLRAVPERATPLRPLVVGVVFGAAWTPCVGPLLGAALTIAAASGQAVRGTLLLVAYAVGIGVPFVLASLGLASSTAARRRLQRISSVVQRVGGVLLVALGVLLVTGAYQRLTSYLARFTPTVGGL
jgi:cytochrome c-type biogenesis protein